MIKRYTSFFSLGTLLILGLYLVTHLWNLTSLPVFADESIYIRWAQLIMEDWQQYLFFPLNDGKTPLQMWLTLPLLSLFKDPLFAGRLVAVAAGAGQVLVMGAILQALKARKKTVLLGMLVTAVLPFWFFHHRMALLDGLMTFWATLALWGSIRSIQEMAKSKIQIKHWFDLGSWMKLGISNWKWILLTGVSLGLALLTKLPAILLFPAMGWFIFWPKKHSLTHRLSWAAWIGVSMVIGLALFFSLKLHPAFGQLFNRGSDFLYPWQEVVLGGKWVVTLSSVPNYASYFIRYLTLPIMLLAVAGLFAKHHQKSIHLLWLSALSFVGPIMFLGLVVYPRYLFPASIFLTLAAVLEIEDFYLVWIEKQKNLLARAVYALFLGTLLAQALTLSAQSIGTQLFAPDQTSFVSSDKTQYLYEWSSGHGILESVEFIQTAAADHTVAVATEGYFGTLPDAILMYLHNTDVSNIYVEGIGYPVKKIPETFSARAGSFDQTLLIVNSHRQELEPSPTTLLTEYCRPDNAPCLQVWDITDLIEPSSDDSQNL